MASVTKRTGTNGKISYLVRIRRVGKKTVTKTFSKKVEADKFIQNEEARVASGTYIDRREAEKTSLRTALERYQHEKTSEKKSKRTEESLIRGWLATDLAEKSLAELKPSDFKAYSDKRLKCVSNQTVRHELKLIRHLFNVADREWLIPVENPLKRIDLPAASKARDRRISVEEERYLIQAAENSGATDAEGNSLANPWIAPIIQFALATAMRQGEILSLEWKDLNFENSTAMLWETKNGENRRVPLFPAALVVLNSIPKATSGKVFATSTEALRQSWARCVARGRRLYLADRLELGKAAKDGFLEGLHFHDLRHEATSRFFEMGLDMMAVAHITGHKTLQMLKRYTHLDSAKIAAQGAKLASPPAADDVSARLLKLANELNLTPSQAAAALLNASS